jgi:hypothetical protein
MSQKKPPTFDQPSTIVGSGVWLAPALVLREIHITSPYLQPAAPIEPVDYAEGAQAAALAAEMKKRQEGYLVSQQVLKAYADKVIEVARKIKERAYDIVLCPLRGARMPGLQANIICKTEFFQPFDGTNMSRGNNDERILADLRRLIFDKPMTGDARNIGILDTAIGGHSCTAFSRLLRILNDETKETWYARFHLIHEEGRRPDVVRQAYQNGSTRLILDIDYHPVVSLLIEDEAALLGYNVQSGRSETSIYRIQRDGQILLQQLDKVTLYRRAPLDETMIALVAKEIMDRIQQLPDIRPVNLD